MTRLHLFVAATALLLGSGFFISDVEAGVITKYQANGGQTFCGTSFSSSGYIFDSPQEGTASWCTSKYELTCSDGRYGTITDYRDPNECYHNLYNSTGGRYGYGWVPASISSQDVNIDCGPKAGTTEQFRKQVTIGTTSSDSFFMQLQNAGSCGAMVSYVNECYTELTGENAGNSYCVYSMKYTGEDYIGSDGPLDKKAPESPSNDSFEQTSYDDSNSQINNDWPENGCITDGNGVQTCVAKTQETTENYQKETFRWDNQSGQIDYSKLEGSSQQVTTTTTTVTNTDGSKTETVQSTTSITSSGGVTSKTTGTSTNTVSVDPSTRTTTSTTVRTYDTDGDLINEQTTVDDDVLCADGTKPPCDGDESLLDGFRNTDTSEIDSYIEGLKNPTSPIGPEHTPELDFSLGALGTCDNADYQATVLGYTWAPDICYWVNIIQSILYWFFAAATVIYGFKTLANEVRGA